MTPALMSASAKMPLLAPLRWDGHLCRPPLHFAGELTDSSPQGGFAWRHPPPQLTPEAGSGTARLLSPKVALPSLLEQIVVVSYHPCHRTGVRGGEDVFQALQLPVMHPPLTSLEGGHAWNLLLPVLLQSVIQAQHLCMLRLSAGKSTAQAGGFLSPLRGRGKQNHPPH